MLPKYAAEMPTSPLVMESAPPEAPMPMAWLLVKRMRVRDRDTRWSHSRQVELTGMKRQVELEESF